jgi:hypothetical protein
MKSLESRNKNKHPTQTYLNGSSSRDPFCGIPMDGYRTPSHSPILKERRDEIVPNKKKGFVSIYCKVFTDSFSNDMVSRFATGDEIYCFLMKDAGQSYDESGDLIPGDINLWYLGCNEKFGCLIYKDFVFSWDFGESSFDRVEAFCYLIYSDGIFTKNQFETLMEKIQEGRLIDNMYDIPAYLKAKREGKSWVKTREAYEFRQEMKSFVGRVKEHLEAEGFMFIDPV